MTPRPRQALATLLLASIFGACSTRHFGLAQESLGVVVENPHGLDLRLCTEIDGKESVVARPGREHSWRATLHAGKYWLACQEGPLCAVPLLQGALPTQHLVVQVTPGGTSSAAWACIPAGPALIGDELGVGQEDERPLRVVTLATFWIARTEVTNAEYARFLSECGQEPDPAWLAFDSKKCLVVRDPAGGRFTTSAPTLPVVTVSLAGALAYCAWLTRTTGIVHRLPSELEWEKAARGPGSRVYAFGNVYRLHAANAESGALAAVATFPANGWGVFDMTGNAFEWVADRYALGPDQVLRGGSFVLDGMYLRNSFRMRTRPSTRADDFGFRPVREAAPDAEKTKS